MMESQQDAGVKLQMHILCPGMIYHSMHIY